MIGVALQTQAVLSRAWLFALSDEACSRLSMAPTAGDFIGSAAATTLWSAGGWTAVTISATALCCFALTLGHWDAEFAL